MATNPITEIKKLLGSEKLILGSKRTLKFLRQGKLSKIFITSNCPAAVARDIESHKGDAEVIVLSQANEELGAICKKPFSISLAGVLK